MLASIRVFAESDRVILNYRHLRGDGEWEDKNYPVRLDWTNCNFGGKRVWFLCPGQNCGRRVAILYGGGIFVCRHCRWLAYPSQREVDYDQATRRADKIRKKLGWQQGIFNPPGCEKPRGMHWNTFSRLVARHDAYAKEALDEMARRFGLFKDIMEKGPSRRD
uniref:Uncharacterized protein n=1 Tax=Candidatus Kentrum eta TaxID=2126337 RepID=A0A450VMD8_9GAMM|nr:MAG: hypothetical protein BECKH772B_GA0070898_103243 [Candidatus Kentron sp. H]VFK03380.1 MAG: hypothetical protein BECKH772A_GA0070896_103213 [Candidatus Kentron sp. H]VFK05982.1 MAG: hypothetical protein BECKH772C_GA0070978_103183 [Candidatus Kentron sp. H]